MYVIARDITLTEYDLYTLTAGSLTAITSANNAVININTSAFPSGITPVANDRIVVQGVTGSDATHYNGIYTITGIETSGSSTVLTTSRSTSAASANAGTSVSTGNTSAVEPVLEDHYLTPGTQNYPADRCTWQTAQLDTGGYRIENAVFYDGNSSTGTSITGARLGYIGKSGRFVEIAS